MNEILAHPKTKQEARLIAEWFDKMNIAYETKISNSTKARRTPNTATHKAIKEAREGKGERFDSLTELFDGQKNDRLIQYGQAKKPFEEFTDEDFKKAAEKACKRARKRAWAVGSPVYYSLNGKLIAEYESGKKMLFDVVNGQVVETGVFDE